MYVLCVHLTLTDDPVVELGCFEWENQLKDGSKYKTYKDPQDKLTPKWCRDRMFETGTTYVYYSILVA